METVQGRLASFKLQPAKRRVNEPHASTSAWPHHPTRFSVTPSTLAAAGFYHDPTQSALDNVTCVYCSKGLEGWEDGDDALDEHLKRILDKSTNDRCPWATVMGVKRDFDLFGPEELDGGKHDPLATHLVAARKKTFGEWWTFDGKKGWKPTSDRLAQAGFYSNPLVDAPDTCACAYCDVQLDGWSKSDDPEEEHRSRQPNCFFFTAKANLLGSNKAAKQPLKASTSTRNKAVARDEGDCDIIEELQAATSSKKKTSKKRSATSTSISQEPDVAENGDGAANGIGKATSDVETIDAKPVKGAAKSRKSKAASASTKKRTTKGAKSTVVTAPSEIIELESESEVGERAPAPSKTKQLPKSRKRTTRATADTVSVSDSPPRRAHKASSKTISMDVVTLKNDHPLPSESETLPANEDDVSDPGPSQSQARKKGTSAKSSKSTSSTGSRTTRAKAKTQTSRKASEIPSANDNTDIDSHRAHDDLLSENEGQRSVSSRLGMEVEAGHTDATQSANDLASENITSTIKDHSLDASLSVSNLVATMKLPLKSSASERKGDQGAAERRSTRSKAAGKTVARPTKRSVRSNTASDASAISESDASQAAETEDETPEPTMNEHTNVEDTIEGKDVATPKARSKSVLRHSDDASSIPAHRATLPPYATRIQDTLLGDLQKPMRQSPQTPQSSVGVIAPSPPSVQANVGPSVQRPVKSLPGRKSVGEYVQVALPVSSVSSQPIVHGTSTLNVPTSTAELPPYTRPVIGRGQTALDALLAGPVPNFDSPEKQGPHSQMKRPAPTTTRQPFATLQSMPRQAQDVHAVKEDLNMTVKDWVQSIRKQEIDRFACDSHQLLLEFDLQTQRKREQLLSM